MAAWVLLSETTKAALMAAFSWLRILKNFFLNPISSVYQIGGVITPKFFG
jgi:hypothetical protein